MDQLMSPSVNQLSEQKAEICSHTYEGYHTSPLESPKAEPQYTVLPSNDRRGLQTPDTRERIAGPNYVPRIANPAPLGLCAFALTSFVSNFVNIYAKDSVSNGLDIGLPLAYGGLTQVLAGMW